MVLAIWFAQKNIDDTIMFCKIFITIPFQVCLITAKNNPLQSESVFYECAELTNAQYKLYLQKMIL